MDKTKGELFVRDIMEALESNSDDNVYAMFIRACRFDGWVGDDRAVKQVRLYDIESSDACPLCGKAWQKMRDEFYEEGYRAGQAAYDNMPVSLQDSERGERMAEVLSEMENAVTDLENLESVLEDAKA
ncbi:MAG: hypothetical protein LBQ51_04775 [Desulfovibrio sp.]|nr:hypothetical protein [Desulfovibrio sp.]